MRLTGGPKRAKQVSQENQKSLKRKDVMKHYIRFFALLGALFCLAGCAGKPASSNPSSGDRPSSAVSSSGTNGVLNPTEVFEDVFAPTPGSTAVETTPMEESGLRQPAQGSTALEVNNLFQDYAVLQRNASVPVWGTGEDGKTVTVEFAGQTKTAVVSGGKWRVNLDPMEANTQNRQMVISCGDTVRTANNILVGEVWLAGGQSNMAMSLFNVSNSMKKELLKEKGNDSLREFLVTIERTTEPKGNVTGIWTPADSSKNLVSISTVAYYFAKELQKSLGVPVGIVRAAESATELELWVDAAKVEERGYTNPGKPLKDATDYKAMVMPLFPYALKGMIWYQGEDNVACERTYASYQNIFSILLEDYRAGFENPDMPVIQAMLPKYIHPDEEGWVHFRYVQMEMQENLEGVYTAVTIDTGDPEDIHPKEDKPVVSARMAAIALDRVYHAGEPALSPVCTGGSVSGDKAILTFKNVSRGLIVRGTVADLEVCGADGVWQAASAEVGEDGASLIVSAAGITPTGVRYANALVPSPSLYDKNGLPVAPFYLDSLS